MPYNCEKIDDKMQLNFPQNTIKLRIQDNINQIYDPVRKKWFQFSPEEYVRQHVIQYLIHQKEIPLSLIAVEKQIEVNNMKKRFDLLVFNLKACPIILIECKAPEVELNENVILQIANYNTVFKVKYLFVTNGLQHYCYWLNQNNYSRIKELPEFDKL